MDNSKSTGAQPSEQWGVGDRACAPAFGQSVVNGRVVDLIIGQHPHSRRDNSNYARFRGRDSEGTIVGFDGHYVRMGLRIEEFNYLKESWLSGDQVRKGCKATISFNGVDVYSFDGREMLAVLALVPEKIQALESLPIDITKPKEAEGRKVFYRETPAVVTHIFDDGRVGLRCESGMFPHPPWGEADDEPDACVVEDLLTPLIWWYRE